MPCRTTSNNINLLEILNLIFGNLHAGQIDNPVLDYGIKSILDSFRLLMDLLHHKMLEPALLSRFCIPLDLGGLLFDFITI